MPYRGALVVDTYSSTTCTLPLGCMVHAAPLRPVCSIGVTTILRKATTKVYVYIWLLLTYVQG